MESHLFEELGLTREFLAAVEDLAYREPTPIQRQAIPAIRSGQHVIGIAQTGTGKTAAFLLPVLMQLRYAQGDLPRAIVLAPTKELVIQLYEQALALSKHTDLRIAVLYGGVGRKQQAKVFQEGGVDLVVSTPRRLLEMYEHEELALSKVQILVMDEADRMMDMGFTPQINLLLDVLPRKRQNLLFSATFSPRVEELSWNFMDFPLKIEISPEATPVETVEQWKYWVPNFEAKLALLVDLLQDIEGLNRVLVFVGTKERASAVLEGLERARVKGPMQLIHSNKSQNTRINAFERFRQGELRLLISTDVMARGVDVPLVSHVINFDVPKVHEDYVHRIGRTGRAQCTGSAISFADPSEAWHVARIEERIRMSIPLATWPEHLPYPETGFEEKQEQLRVLDELKRKEDPNFKGAFHEKKDHKAKQKEKAEKRGIPKTKGQGKSFFRPSKPSKRGGSSKRKRGGD